MTLPEELEKLKKLREDGSLSDSEYAEAKADLLAERRRERKRSEVAEMDLAEEIDPIAEDKETRQWALFLHLSMLAGYLVPLGGLVAPIVIWQIKKDELPEIDQHGKNAVNWLISYIIYIVISIPLIFLVVGIFTLIAVVVMGIVFPIIAAVKGHEGKVWRYPLSITFFS